MTPTQMFDHTVAVVAGPPPMYRLELTSIVPASGQSIRQGAVCSVNSSGELLNGVPRGADGNRAMPLWAIQDVNSFDANSDVGNISGGYMSALVATGGYEIETTEYVSGSTYHPNDLLKASTGTAGLVDLAGVSPYAAVPVVGCVSTGVYANKEGKNVLRFWPMFLPAGTNAQA